MLKNFTIKIYFQVVVILLISIIGTGVGSAKSKYSIEESSARFSAEAQFVATVSGTTVNFDWSAMVAADSYTMAVALSEADGNIDMSTLSFLDMGSRKTFSASGLPSGTIFYAAIVADTDQGLVVSNTAEFMPFAGTVTFPMDGAVLMQVDDPGGVGTITVSGVENVAEETMTISQISGDTGFGSFVLTVVNDKPATYTNDDLTMNFTYAADGSVVVQSVRNSVRSAEYDPTDDEDWDQLNDCQQSILLEYGDLIELEDAVVDRLKIIKTTLSRLAQGALKSYFFYKYQQYNTSSAEYYFKLYTKYKGLLDVHYAVETAVDLDFYFDSLELEDEYEACIDDPDHPLGIDNSCPVPAGAEYVEYITSYDNWLSATAWILPGIGEVGPQKSWCRNDDMVSYLCVEYCKDASGLNDGWSITYFENGKMQAANHFSHGVKDGHQYIFNEDGSVMEDIYYENGYIVDQ